MPSHTPAERKKGLKSRSKKRVSRIKKIVRSGRRDLKRTLKRK